MIKRRFGGQMTFTSDYEPFFQPPGWIVGPVWLVLYTTMAISISVVLEKRAELKYPTIVLVLFFAQLALNLSWVGVFNSEKYLTSLMMVIFMVIFTMIYAFLTYEHARKASMLVWPYIAWISLVVLINTAYYLEAS